MNAFSNNKKNKIGFTLLELLMVISIIAVISTGIVYVFSNFRNYQVLNKDSEMITQVLRLARSQTLTSQDSLQYGVHIATSSITLFSGPVYTANVSTNIIFPRTSSDIIITTSLFGGGNDIVFQRLSGETSQYGSITITSSNVADSKIIIIYKTGLIESQL